MGNYKIETFFLSDVGVLKHASRGQCYVSIHIYLQWVGVSEASTEKVVALLPQNTDTFH